MSFRLLGTVFLLSCATLQSVHAQDGRVSVHVIHSGDDSVGTQFVYALREALRASQGYKLTSREDSGIQIRVITLNPEERNQGNWTVASVVYTMTNFLPLDKSDPQTWYPIYLTSQVLTVGRTVTGDQAKAVMATLDRSVQIYREDAKR